MFRRCTARLKIILTQLNMTTKLSTAANNDVLLETIGTTGVITLNRPKALNALNLSMIRQIYPKLVEWDENKDIKLVIIKGSGEKAFCAGGDIRAVTDGGPPVGKIFFKEEYILNNEIGTLKTPYVALIHGIIMGGGVGLSVHGTYRVATEKTLFAMPETGIGLFPDVGGGWFLPRLSGQIGAFLSLTGTRVFGHDAKRVGVATHMVDSSQMGELEKSLLNLKNPEVEDIENSITQYDNKCKEGIDKTAAFSSILDDINNHFSYDTMEEILQSLESAKTDWASKQLQTLKKMSPTSMKITLRLLREGIKMSSLSKDLQMEYRITQRIMLDKDFYEGVRAVLVDKDQNPKWKPQSIEDVTEEKVNHFFSPLEDPLDELVLT